MGCNCGQRRKAILEARQKRQAELAAQKAEAEAAKQAQADTDD